MLTVQSAAPPRDMQPDMVGGKAPGLPKVNAKLPRWKSSLSPNQEKKNQGYHQ